MAMREGKKEEIMKAISLPTKLAMSHVLIPVFATLCLFPFISSAAALIAGLFLALSFGNPYQNRTKKMSPLLLGIAVMGLGAGMNLKLIGGLGLAGIGYTITGISLTFFFGSLLGKIFNTEKDTSLLITMGTAICGGSAIAALAPVIRAKDHEVSIALVTVFLLNAAALLLFPGIGHYFDLTETQFGLWSALAIHDTSSVVGATLHYGPNALVVGTTLKLTRALWIIPVAFLVGFFRSRNEADGARQKVKVPWFIIGFVLVAALVTFFPALVPLGQNIELIAKRLLVLTLFLIGANLTRESLKGAGFRPLMQGLCLWSLVSTFSLLAIMLGWIE